MNMENGEKQNMDNEGKFQNVVPVQSTGDKEILRVAKSELRDQIILRCSHPNSTDCVDFRVEPMMNGHFYNLIYDQLSRYIVHKHNLDHVLTHKKYEKTLQQWLAENDDNWCETYRGWGVNRPKEDARKIIQGILNAVYKLHQNKSFHGFLHHPENFAMDSDELVIGGVHKEIKHISLIHANLKCNPFDCPSGDGDPKLVGMKNDIRAMSKVIFDQILRWDHTTSYPKDLNHLHSLLHADGDSFDWKSIVNHPSLWHWESRFSYIGSVWAFYQHRDDITQGIMNIGFSDINVCRNWNQIVLSNSVLRSIYKYNRYGQKTRDLLRYLRNARFHYKDYCYDEQGTKRYLHIKEEEEDDYLTEQFIELKTTEIDELFLVNLYYKIRDLDLEF